MRQLTHLQVISSTTSTSVQTVSTPPTALNSTVGAYPYDQLPAPSPTSVSSFSADQLTSSGALSSRLESHTLTALSTAATTTASSCGDASADFVIDFDDLPAFSAGPGVCAFPCSHPPL